MYIFECGTRQVIISNKINNKEWIQRYKGVRTEKEYGLLNPVGTYRTISSDILMIVTELTLSDKRPKYIVHISTKRIIIKVLFSFEK